MFEHYRPYYAEINLDNFRHNFREVKRLAAGKKIIGVIKADGYGHGAVELARVLEEENVDYFAVAVITEAIELRKSGFKKPILILGYTPETFAKEIVEYDITQGVFTYELAEAISKEAQRQNKTARIHIKLDTGMGRVGFLPYEDSVKRIRDISKLKNICMEGIFTHFAASDEKDKSFSYFQMERFTKMIDILAGEGIEFEIKHMANSAAIIDLKDSYFDAVRPGIMLYGYYPSDEVNRDIISLKPVMSLKARIVHIKEVPENTPISYGRKFYTRRMSKIATLPFGYADGYTRLLYGKSHVIVNGRLAPIVGRICMDQCMADVTECGDVNVGDEIIVMGSQNGVSITADDIAANLGTINYEVLCTVSKRVPRVFVENGEIVKVKNYI
ncbi:alanine racemase [Fonticella tunisiensis]|uniref:Alanine racemase n=1 Tax=Fonticella tunisiensis TaxID=1096341 RepID=A0A4R7KXF9_9CLOT|nr:alanine racemase [Fonticella tunisiensis]TDT63700.1 alanine racemase [Fonticella tunisiensis]